MTLSPPTSAQLDEAAQINVQLGIYYLEQKDIAAAKAKLLLALAQAPRNALINDAAAYFYEKTGDDSIAEHYYQKAIALAPKAGAAHNNYGAFLYRQHRYQEALAQFIAATADAAYLNTAAAYENAGRAAIALEDKQEARRYFEKAITIDPRLNHSLPS